MQFWDTILANMPVDLTFIKCLFCTCLADSSFGSKSLTSGRRFFQPFANIVWILFLLVARQSFCYSAWPPSPAGDSTNRETIHSLTILLPPLGSSDYDPSRASRRMPLMDRNIFLLFCFFGSKVNTAKTSYSTWAQNMPLRNNARHLMDKETFFGTRYGCPVWVTSPYA